jgi:aspartate aminotransferase-like enzyme
VKNFILFCLVIKFTIAQSENGGMTGVDNPVQEMACAIKGKGNAMVVHCVTAMVATEWLE